MRNLQRGIDSYYWLVDEVPQFNSGQYFHIPGPQPGQSTRVRVVVTNNCGGQYEFGMTVYGTTEIDGYSCQVNRQAPPTPKGAYPNPADAALTVEQAAGSTMTIFNSQGSTMYSGKNGKRAAIVDTRSWPAGPYYLVRRYEQGRATRQIIRVEH